MEVAPGSKEIYSEPASPGPGYIFFRICNIATLIAAFACLAQVMNTYSKNGVSTPSGVVYMFAVGIIGTVWSLLILITFLRFNNVSFTIAFFDFVGVVLCIAGVAILTKPAIDDCAAAKAGVQNDILRTRSVNAVCGLLRAGWGLSLANILLFFLCCVGGYQIASIVADEYKRLGGPVARRTVIEEGYPIDPAVRNIRQTTTASVPVRGPVVVEKKRHGSSSHRHSSSHRGDRSRRHSYSAGTNRDSYYTEKRDRDSHRGSSRY
ncbi:hypothetical protein Dda_4684 [Drechslerella dactyloides]|uniref:MARVEL domain-containing protein n=1 Tax=Drechslerella dactyloides TaxID=74499 RepID=A0AAD6IXE9_DREDA|nr:hypothetical protein Dda_4684 [Drechslerella dactyloides]